MSSFTGDNRTTTGRFRIVEQDTTTGDTALQMSAHASNVGPRRAPGEPIEFGLVSSGQLCVDWC
jgi:hypothetical protein